MAYGELLTRLNPCDPKIVTELLSSRIQRGASVIDIGCGRGTTLAWLSKHTGYVLFGVEPDAELSAEARINCPAAVFAHAGAEALPFCSLTFDAILMECVFSLLDDPEPAVKELYRILKPEGFLLFSDLYTRSRDDLCAGQSALFRYIYTKQTIESFFLSRGFAPDTFLDRTADIGSMIAQMYMDGVDRDCIGDAAAVKLLRQAKTGYGIWLWSKT